MSDLPLAGRAMADLCRQIAELRASLAARDAECERLRGALETIGEIVGWSHDDSNAAKVYDCINDALRASAEPGHAGARLSGEVA